MSFATGPIGPLSDRAYLASTGNVTWLAGSTGIQVCTGAASGRERASEKEYDRDRDRETWTEIEIGLLMEIEIATDSGV